MKYKLILIAIFCMAISSNGQQLIRGKIVDGETKQALPYAHLSISNTGLGSASNEEGYFQIDLPQSQNQILQISYLGYANRYYPIDSLLNTGIEQFSFELHSQPLILADVLVTDQKVTPEEMILQAIQAVPKNYYQQPFNLEFYTRTSVRDSTTEIYLLETILETYRKGYTKNNFNAISIVQKRETGKDPLPKSVSQKTGKKYSSYFPGFDIFFSDTPGIGTGYSVFNTSLHKRLKFGFIGVSVFDKDTVCIIEYSTRKKNLNEKEDLEGNYSGVIYIAANNLAIIRHAIKLNNTQTEIFYKRVDEHYFPYLVKSSKPAKADNKILEVKYESIQTKVIQNQVKAFQQRATETYLDSLPYNKDFWKRYQKY